MSNAKNIPEKLARQFRAMPVVREQAEGDDPNRFSFALSSEEPAEQWFGTEVLKHDSKSIRQGRLKNGVPLLFNHDPNQHLGVVDSYQIKDSKLRVQGKWSSSELAREKQQDYNDGILKDASVGYLIHKISRDQEGEYPSSDDTLNVTDWEPLEASLVTIPADPTVGAGRAVGDQEFPVVVEVHHRQVAVEPTAAPAAIPVVIEVRKMAEEVKVPDAGQLEIARRDRIMALASDKDFSRHVTSAEVREAFEKGTTVEAFSESLSRKIIAANDANKVGTVGGNVMVDAGRDARRYSFGRMVRSLVNDAKPGTYAAEDGTFEREVSKEIGKRLGVSGTYVPNAASRTLSAGASGTGQTPQPGTIETFTESSYIEMYRNRPRVLSLGAQRMGGLSGLVRIPRQNGASNWQWLAEGSAVVESDITTDFISLSPKRISAQNAYYVELLAQSAVDVEALLATDRAKTYALAIDSATLLAAVGGAPNGLFGQSGLALITTTGTALTTGNAPSYKDILNFEAVVAEANADVATMGWLCTPQTRALLKGTPMFPAGYAMPIWAGNQRDPSGLEEGPLGYKAGVTNQVPKNFGTGLDLHALVLGDWSQVVVADWGASELIVDPYTQAASGAFVVTERTLADVEFRHIAAFAVSETVAVV